MFNIKDYQDQSISPLSGRLDGVVPYIPESIAQPDDALLPATNPIFAKINYSSPLNSIKESYQNSSVSSVLKSKRDQIAAKAEAKKASLDEYTKMNSNKYQDLYTKSKYRNHAYDNSHDFRNQRHAEFIEQNPYAVRLKSMIAANTVVAFRVSPEISETRTVGYKTIDPLHMPGAIQVFQNSAPRNWSVAAIKLVSRNGVEAEENLAIINQLRAWQMPFFGKSRTQGKEDYKYEMFGAPPEVLEFSAYSNSADGVGLTNIRKIPVVITSLTIPYPTDVDYIQTATTKQPFPVIMSIDMTLVETHSPRDFERFNLIDYKNGNLRGF
jgi:hypothetical protein